MARRRQEERTRIGRPPKPLAEQQRNRVSAMFTDAELEALQKAADGRALGTLLREIALRYLRRRR